MKILDTKAPSTISYGGLIEKIEILRRRGYNVVCADVETMALGTPIEEGLLVMGNINVTGSSGEADLAIPIAGPESEGTIYAVAEKSAGKWAYSILEVEVKTTGERIDLLE